MNIRDQIAYLVVGTAIWLVTMAFMSGLLPTSPLPNVTYAIGVTLGLCAAALVPSGTVALVSFLVSRRIERAVRLWWLLASLMAIFIALGLFALKETGRFW